MKGGYLRLRPVITAFSWIAITILAYIAALYLGLLIARLVGINNVVGLLSLHSLLLMVMLVIVVWSPAIISRARLTLSDIGLQKALEWRDGLWGVGGFAVYSLIMSIVVPLVAKIAWFDTDQSQQLGFNGMAGLTLFAGFIVLVIITPVAEEMLFRGVLQGRLRAAGIPFSITALIVGGLFALAHGQWNVAIDVFFMSLVASYLRERTGRLWPSIVVHVLKNTLAFYVTFVVVAGTLR
ncbi:CPBP family intramembrane metalloprotease [Microbacteriaceae bacterium]|nr:CPBP family intramembrane metalloprotease [Candidatus Saccharibacteria bacterium]